MDNELFTACSEGNIEYMRDYLINGGDPNYVFNNEVPILFYAVSDNQREIINLLLEHGANINLQDQFGQTALFLIVDGCIDGMIQSGEEIENDSIETINFILSKGADPNLPDNNGLTALGVAEHYNYQPIIELLRGKNS